jgi:hypothetical protein
LFIKIEGMSPAEYKNGGKNLTIKDNLAKTSLENSSKSQDIFITNRVIYLALWLDYLDKNSLANIRF